MNKTIKAGDSLSLKEIENEINASEEYDVISFEGVFRFGAQIKRLFTLGREVVSSMLMVGKANLTLDFSKSRFVIEVKEMECETAFLYLFKSARNTKLYGLNLFIRHSGGPCKKSLYGLYNCGHSFSVRDSNIEIVSSTQINAIAVYNFGGLDTHLDTQADNCSIVNSRIKVDVQSEKFVYENTVFGLKNYFANSIQVSDCYFDIKNRGNSERQRAIAIENNGRFCRFSNNNIKANASHNKGKVLTEAHACGMIDAGMYSLISNCNVVGEWGGSCVGLLLKGEFTKVNGCKILATHTIKGTTVKIEGKKIILSDNILTGTSRNARIVYSCGDVVTIMGNMMEVLMNPDDCISGVGAYFENATDGIFSNNQIRTIKNCGLYLKNSQVIRKDNLYQKEGNLEQFVSEAHDDMELEGLFDENRIYSLPEED